MLIFLLTARLGGGLEDPGDVHVHLDFQVVLHHDLLIPLLDAVLNPAGEHALENGGADVANPLLGHFMDFLGVRQVIEDLLVAIRKELRDVLDCETIVLWN